MHNEIPDLLRFVCLLFTFLIPSIEDMEGGVDK